MLPFKSVRNPRQMGIVTVLPIKMGIEGGSGARVNGESHRCAQCGRDGAELEAYYGEASAWLHRGACEDGWKTACDDLTIPAYLDRRA